MFLFGKRGVPAESPGGGTIEQTLAVFFDSGASAASRSDAETDLLGSLSIESDLETRVRIIEGLIRADVDESLHALLEEHLLDIKDEATDLGKDQLAEKAEGLLGRLRKTTE